MCTQDGRKWDQSGIKHIGREDGRKWDHSRIKLIGREDGRANVVKGKREGDDKPVQDK